MLLSDYPHDIHVIGMGGIGTHVLQALLELGARRVHLWDSDFVEAHNLPTQFLYSRDDIGVAKVTAAARFVHDRGFETEIVEHIESVTRKTELSGIVISGVDTMKSREEIWQAISFNPIVHFYIDARIGGSVLQIHSLDPTDPAKVEDYMTWLVPDALAPDLGCVTRENPHAALGISMFVSAQLTVFIDGKLPLGYLQYDPLAESQAVSAR